MGNTFTIGLLGASDVQNYSCREWPQIVARGLQVGKRQRVRRMGFGLASSVQHLADGSVSRLVAQRVDAAVLSFYKDADYTMSVSVAQSLANMYTIIDAIRAKRPDCAIFLLKTWRLFSSAETARFPNLSSYWANYTTVAANRSNVTIIDAYGAWGDPDLHPAEYDSGDLYHPLLPGLARVTIPESATALAPLIV